MASRSKVFKVSIVKPVFDIDLKDDSLAVQAKKQSRALLREGSRSGRKYRRLPFRSSAPGEAPRDQLGKGNPKYSSSLHQSIRARSFPRRVDGSRRFELFSDAPYAQILEEGSEYGKIASRPFMRPAVQSVVSKFLKDLTVDSMVKTKNKKGF